MLDVIWKPEVKLYRIGVYGCERSWFNHTRCDCAVLTRRGEDGHNEGVGEEQDRVEISRACWGGHQQKAIKLQAEAVCFTQTPILKNREERVECRGVKHMAWGPRSGTLKSPIRPGCAVVGGATKVSYYNIVCENTTPPNTASPGLTQGLWSRTWKICESETMCLFYYFHQFKAIKTLLTLLKTLLRHICMYSAGHWCRAFRI